MDISEILKNAGVEDEAVIKAVAEAMPKAYMPLRDFNERIAKAKGETEAANAKAEELEKAVEAAKAASEGEKGESAKAIEELTKQIDALKAENQAAKDAERKRETTDALSKALKEAGANPAAIGLLANAALGSVEYGADGKASNLDEAVKAVKEANAELFGKFEDNGHSGGKGDDDNDPTDAFLKGFGDTSGAK